MSNCIYKFTNILNGHIYIGMTNNSARRYREHLRAAYNESDKDYNSPFHKAIRKHGIENFKYEILEENIKDASAMKDREKYWISYYNAYRDRQHYNATPGGDSAGENSILKGEKHGMSKLTEQDVLLCRKLYENDENCREVYNKSFKDKITLHGFIRMWYGYTWKHIMPEVFENRKGKKSYTKKDRDFIVEKYNKSGMSVRAFSKTEECYVGYGTLWKMINEPQHYN